MMLTMVPAAFAADSTEMSNDIDGTTFCTGVSKEFTILTTIGDDAAGKTVLGTSEFDGEDAISSMEYYDETTKEWKNLLHDGDGNFGPADGIQIPADASGQTIKNLFRVTFKQPREFTFTAALTEKDTNAEIASTSASFTVEPSYEFSITGVADQMAANQWDNEASAILKGNTGAQDYTNARILVQVSGPDGSNPQIMASDGQQEHNLAITKAWGPEGGFPVSGTTNNETPLRLCFDMAGVYTATFQLVDTQNGNAVITEGSTSITVVDSSVELDRVSVVGEDGYTEVTAPIPGQKLTANIVLSDGTVIGSYPRNVNAQYKWYYAESPDTILGTEPVYTVTSDNLDKTLCVEVDVDGYTGGPLTWKADNAAANAGKLVGVSVVDGTDGYTPVTNPQPGQKLTANITVEDAAGNQSVIGSYPRNDKAYYKWYYAENPDNVLGTEPVYTVTSDNLGKTLCVNVSVDGYEGTATWTSGNETAEGTLISVSVVDGTDGYTPVSIPVQGQKLTANIYVRNADTTYETIGSYPVDSRASYKWYYAESPDTILGTEPVYTVTSDNLGKTLCVDVDVDGYTGGPLTWVADNVVGVYTITFDANGGSFEDGATAKEAMTNYSGELDVDSVEEPTRSGYTFEGWETEDGEDISGTYTFTDNTTLRAVWDRRSSGGSSGGGGGSSSSTYSVSVSPVDNGSVSASPSRASEGATVTITVTPDDGYELDTLTVTDADGNNIRLTDAGDGKYTFTMPDSRVTVTATFTEIGAVDSFPFNDVSSSAWYREAVEYVYENGMMNGTSDTAFSPNATTTRAMIVTILHRLENEPSASASSFTDVVAGSYYENAVNWAAANGIVNGVSETSFAPNTAITREQMAAILYRYAQFKGYDVTASNDLSSYTDASQISAYATTAMQWANAEGLITGNTSTTLNPQGNATRAEVATILMRFCENIAK